MPKFRNFHSVNLSSCYDQIGCNALFFSLNKVVLDIVSCILFDLSIL